MNYKVHVAYGFHVNCYHSYRGDTNDKQGFGGDIRIMRKTIDILNEFNEKGVPVKATWDFENAYSIEDILPKYAPDILENVRLRCIYNGDENIIMGYNNGALSAMNEEELSASINLAVTNDKKSGLKDVFGNCEMIVRPQEVMFSPSQVSVYNKLGVKALCLYYSCVPFDAFRTFIPQLNDELAFNPLTYTYKNESITIVPTYSNSDLMDAGSLRYLVYDLHKQQQEGKINNDVLVFINMDADSVFWEPMAPKALSGIPNLDGIHGLIKEVADLDYVVYDTVGGYLKNHEPLCNVDFKQDTADGSFSGYSNWAEKPFNCQIWTRLERARAYAKMYKNDSNSPSFNDRVMLLSTTHFGLASPVLNVQREKKALDLSERMLVSEIEKTKKQKQFTINNISGSDITSIQLAIDDGFIKSISELSVKGSNLLSFVAQPMELYESGCIKTLFAVLRFKSVNKTEKITFSNDGKYKTKSDKLELCSENLKIRFCEHGNILSVKYKDKYVGGKNFLNSFIHYEDQFIHFSNSSIKTAELAGDGYGFTVTGQIHLPTELESGNYSFNFYVLDGVDCVFTDCHIKYPYTKEETEISTQASALGRKTDVKWIESVPFSITPVLKNGISVVKRNYMDDISSYKTEDFGKCFSENINLDSFNHHLTNGLIALSDGETGFLVAIAKQVNNSMACCPMRLRNKNGKEVVTLNPFGSYYGNQRQYPTRSNGSAAEAFVIVSPQARSIAPAYNGVEQWFNIAFMCYEGLEPDEKTMNTVRGFSEGCVANNSQSGKVKVFNGDNVNFKAITENKITDSELKSAVASGTAQSKSKTIKTGLKVVKTIFKAKIKSYKA